MSKNKDTTINTEGFSAERAPNGCWIVRVNTDKPGLLPITVSVLTSTVDLLEYLGKELGDLP